MEKLIESDKLVRLLGEEYVHSIRCSICLDYFERPVVLACGHTFCCKCIKDTAEHALARHRSRPPWHVYVECPHCRKPTNAYQTTNENLPKNYTLSALISALQQVQIHTVNHASTNTDPEVIEAVEHPKHEPPNFESIEYIYDIDHLDMIQDDLEKIFHPKDKPGNIIDDAKKDIDEIIHSLTCDDIIEVETKLMKPLWTSTNTRRKPNNIVNQEFIVPFENVISKPSLYRYSKPLHVAEKQNSDRRPLSLNVVATANSCKHSVPLYATATGSNTSYDPFKACAIANSGHNTMPLHARATAISNTCYDSLKASATTSSGYNTMPLYATATTSSGYNTMPLYATATTSNPSYDPFKACATINAGQRSVFEKVAATARLGHNPVQLLNAATSTSNKNHIPLKDCAMTKFGKISMPMLSNVSAPSSSGKESIPFFASVATYTGQSSVSNAAALTNSGQQSMPFFASVATCSGQSSVSNAAALTNSGQQSMPFLASVATCSSQSSVSNAAAPTNSGQQSMPFLVPVATCSGQSYVSNASAPTNSGQQSMPFFASVATCSGQSSVSNASAPTNSGQQSMPFFASVATCPGQRSVSNNAAVSASGRNSLPLYAHASTTIDQTLTHCNVSTATFPQKNMTVSSATSSDPKKAPLPADKVTKSDQEFVSVHVSATTNVNQNYRLSNVVTAANSYQNLKNKPTVVRPKSCPKVSKVKANSSQKSKLSDNAALTNLCRDFMACNASARESADQNPLSLNAAAARNQDQHSTPTHTQIKENTHHNSFVSKEQAHLPTNYFFLKAPPRANSNNISTSLNTMAKANSCQDSMTFSAASTTDLQQNSMPFISAGKFKSNGSAETLNTSEGTTARGLSKTSAALRSTRPTHTARRTFPDQRSAPVQQNQPTHKDILNTGKGKDKTKNSTTAKKNPPTNKIFGATIGKPSSTCIERPSQLEHNRSLQNCATTIATTSANSLQTSETMIVSTKRKASPNSEPLNPTESQHSATLNTTANQHSMTLTPTASQHSMTLNPTARQHSVVLNAARTNPSYISQTLDPAASQHSTNSNVSRENPFQISKSLNLTALANQLNNSETLNARASASSGCNLRNKNATTREKVRRDRKEAPKSPKQ